jgi:hypothetical protein
MKFLELAFELFMLYLLYKFIFDFIIPVYNTSKQVKKQFTDMHAQMRQKMEEQQRAAQQSQSQRFTAKPEVKSTTKDREDYIDFEEVK